MEYSAEEIRTAALSTITDTIAMALEEGYTMTHEGLDFLLDLFVHLVSGGNLYNYPSAQPEECFALLATIWTDSHRQVKARDADPS